ncbi:PAS domain-containing sensor histidine kinase [Nisaea sp.]|uniref:PAS domain-containing sensor histidine kinase n=1 Tax=Nisaea sp. TaxID=2024842 RepID=UPI003B516D31
MSRAALHPVTLFLLAMTVVIGVTIAAGAAGVVVVDIIRGYSNGATYYAKGHLSAVSALYRFARTGDDRYYEMYRRRLHPTLSNGVAREILDAEDLPIDNSYTFLIQGKNHPNDVAGIAWFYRAFKDTPAFRPARETWVRADAKVRQIDALADALRQLVLNEPGNLSARQEIVQAVERIDDELIHLEERFSLQLGATARSVSSFLLWGLAALGVLLAILIWVLGVAVGRRLKAARDTIHDRESRLADIVEVAADWVWETDAEHRFTYLSQRFEQLVGLSVEAVLGRRRWDFAGAEPDERWRRHLDDLDRHRPFRDFEYVFRDSGGEEHHFRINGKPVFDASGLFIGYRGTGSDITEAVEARREAAAKQDLLEATFQHMDQGISVFDANLTAVAFNQRYLELLDLPGDRFAPGVPFEAFVRFNAERGEYGPGDVEALVAERIAEVRRAEPRNFERKRPDGTVLETIGRPLPGGGFVTTYTDVTERNRTIEALRSAKLSAEMANQAKTLFLANMSHELRTPLNAVIGFSSLLAESSFGPLNDRYVDYARDIHQSGLHLLSVINDILDLSKVEVGHVEISLEPVSPRAATESCFRLLQERADASGISLVNEVPEEASPLIADKRLLRQILLNLVGNAIKFSHRGGIVSVRHVTAADNRSGLEVRDQGVGMAQDEIARAMQPFVQLDTGYARMHEGTGLGLALVHRYLELHDGALSISSKPDAGTVATALFPEPADLHMASVPGQTAT